MDFLCVSVCIAVLLSSIKKTSQESTFCVKLNCFVEIKLHTEEMHSSRQKPWHFQGCVSPQLHLTICSSGERLKCLRIECHLYACRHAWPPDGLPEGHRCHVGLVSYLEVLDGWLRLYSI